MFGNSGPAAANTVREVLEALGVVTVSQRARHQRQPKRSKPSYYRFPTEHPVPTQAPEGACPAHLLLPFQTTKSSSGSKARNVHKAKHVSPSPPRTLHPFTGSRQVPLVEPKTALQELTEAATVPRFPSPRPKSEWNPKVRVPAWKARAKTGSVPSVPTTGGTPRTKTVPPTPKKRGRERSPSNPSSSSSESGSPSRSWTYDLDPCINLERPPGVTNEFWKHVVQGTTGLVRNAQAKSTERTYTNLIRNADAIIKPILGRSVVVAKDPAQMMVNVSMIIHAPGVLRRGESGKFARNTFATLIAAVKKFIKRKGLPSPFDDVLHCQHQNLADLITGTKRAAIGPADKKYAPTRTQVQGVIEDAVTARDTLMRATKLAKDYPLAVKPILRMPRIGQAAKVRLAILAIIGFYGVRRTQEVVELRYSDVQKGTQGEVLRVRTSKCDQMGRGHKAFIPNERQLLLFLEAWKGFVEVNFGAQAVDPEAPIFISIYGKSKKSQWSAGCARRALNVALDDVRGGQSVSLRRGGACYTTSSSGSAAAISTGGRASDQMLNQIYAPEPAFLEAAHALKMHADHEKRAERVWELEKRLHEQRLEPDEVRQRIVENAAHLWDCDDTRKIMLERIRDKSTSISAHKAVICKGVDSERGRTIRKNCKKEALRTAQPPVFNSVAATAASVASGDVKAGIPPAAASSSSKTAPPTKGAKAASRKSAKTNDKKNNHKGGGNHPSAVFQRTRAAAVERAKSSKVIVKATSRPPQHSAAIRAAMKRSK